MEYVNRAHIDAIYEWDVVADAFPNGERFFTDFWFCKKEEAS